jgi:hypothetical protein
MQVLNVFEQHCASRRPGLEFDRAGAAGLYDLRHMRKRGAGWRVRGTERTDPAWEPYLALAA